MVIPRPAAVMVVDDVSFMRTVLKDMLVNQGIASTVYEAADGLDAVETYRKFRPDIVTLDVIMPKMDGIQALREILRMDPRAKVVMITSEKNRAAIQEAIKIGAKDYVLKPFERAHIGPVFERIMKLRD